MADSKKVLAAGKYMRLVKLGNWEFAERTTVGGAVVVVAITSEKKLILIEQARIPVGRTVIELPAGLVGDLPNETEDDWEAAANRELLEETGYTAKRVKYLMGGPISAGFGNEMVVFCQATGVKRVGDGGGVDGENIRVHEIELPKVEAFLRRKVRGGALVDPKIYAGLYFATKSLR